MRPYRFSRLCHVVPPGNLRDGIMSRFSDGKQRHLFNDIRRIRAYIIIWIRKSTQEWNSDSSRVNLHRSKQVFRTLSSQQRKPRHFSENRRVLLRIFEYSFVDSRKNSFELRYFGRCCWQLWTLQCLLVQKCTRSRSRLARLVEANIFQR